MDWLNKQLFFFTLIVLNCFVTSCTSKIQEHHKNPTEKKNTIMNDKNTINKSDEEWKSILSAEQYYVLREAGTERPFTGKYNMHFEEGVYTCAGCDTELFSSSSKFDGHCGWPSFDEELSEGKIIKKIDNSYGMKRVEILCGNCGGHLGHLFDDGPTESGLRYCVNSLSLDFKKKNNQKLCSTAFFN